MTVGTTTRLVRRSAVRWVQAQGDYSRLVTDTEQFLVREPLSDLEERWAPAGSCACTGRTSWTARP